MDPEPVTYGPDYDPDDSSELLYDSAGTPVTNDYLERLADELEQDGALPEGTSVEFRVTGRPSLTAPGRMSPSVNFRISADLREAVEARAKREGKTVSAVAREALERYVS